MRALFTTQPGAGHWRPLAPIVRELVTAGHEAAFATTPVFCEIIAQHGFQCFPMGVDDWVEDSQQIPEGQPEPEQAASVWANLFAGIRAERSLPDLLAVCREWRPDVVVREISEFSGCLAAERLGLPHAAMQVSAFRPHLHQLIGPALNRLRHSVGLPFDPGPDMLYRYLFLTPIPADYRDSATPFPPTTHAIQHISYDHDTDEQLPEWIDQIPQRPVVYATLGTAYNRTPGIFSTILLGLREEPVTITLTVGNQDPAVFGEQPPHIHIERYVPQSLLFPHCDLVISHGGFGTITTALGHGLPQVIIPIAADQPDNARRYAELGMAKAIEPHQRTPKAIREAVREVLQSPDYRQDAERFRDSTRTLPGPEHAVGLLERLSEKRQPLKTTM